MSNLIPIAHLGRRIADVTKRPGPPARKIYDLTLRGAIPAQNVNGRWFVAEDDIPKVFEALGIEMPAPAKPPARRSTVTA